MQDLKKIFLNLTSEKFESFKHTREIFLLKGKVLIIKYIEWIKTSILLHKLCKFVICYLIHYPFVTNYNLHETICIDLNRWSRNTVLLTDIATTNAFLYHGR